MATGDAHEIAGQDIEALMATRSELGPAYDAALVDSFAERIERAVAERADGEVARREASASVGAAGDVRQMYLGMVSLGTGIPISAIVANAADLPGLVVAWAGIVGVNVAYAWRGRRRRQ